MSRYRTTRIHRHVLYLTVVTMSTVCIFSWTRPENDENSNVNVVGYYQTSGSNALAASVVIRFFRSVYPTAPLYIHYDTDHAIPTSGADLITHNENQVDKSAVSKGMYFSSVIAMEAYIQRIKTAAGLQKNGWVLLLEDDVWVWAGIKQNDLKYDSTGRCRHKFSIECAGCLTAIRAHSRDRQAFRNESCYGAYGGTYLNSSRILGLKYNHGLLQDLLSSVKIGAVASDLLLSSVILVDGGSIGDNPGFYEPYDLSQLFSNIKYGPPNIFHLMKWLYLMRYIFDY